MDMVTWLQVVLGIFIVINAAVNRIIEDVLGDESPDMNDAFRAFQAEIFETGALAEDRRPDLKLFEIKALAFRGGWEGRDKAEGVLL